MVPEHHLAALAAFALPEAKLVQKCEFATPTLVCIVQDNNDDDDDPLAAFFGGSSMRMGSMRMGGMRMGGGFGGGGGGGGGCSIVKQCINGQCTTKKTCRL